MHYQSQQQRHKNKTQKRIKTAFFYCLIFIFFWWSTAHLGTIAQPTETGGLNGPEMRKILDEGNLTEAVTRIELDWEEDYQKYLSENFGARSKTAEEISKTLSRLAVKTQKKPALIYAIPRTDQLELILILPDRAPILRSIPDAKLKNLQPVATAFSSEITNPRKINTTSYLEPAQKLYQWIIAPLEADLSFHNDAAMTPKRVYAKLAGIRMRERPLQTIGHCHRVGPPLVLSLVRSNAKGKIK